MIVTTQCVALLQHFILAYILKKNFVSPYILITFGHEYKKEHHSWNEWRY